MATTEAVLLKGVLTSNSKEHHVTLSVNGFRWQLQKDKKSTRADTIVPWSDIYGVSSATEKRKKGPTPYFTVHYISRRADKKWRATEKRFNVNEGNTTDWVNQVQALYRPGTPKNLLVIINPIGGSGQARQNWEKKVSVLFKMAGINCDVIFTEKSKHVEEIVASYDLSKIEGIIAMGGDGTYQEIINTLLQRVQREAGVDYQNYNHSVAPLTIKIGILPAGTGNGLAMIATTVVDMETSALHIIKGDTRYFNIHSCHEPHRFITYSGLLLGVGFCSDLVKKSEEHRSMKRLRYPYVVMKQICATPRYYAAEMTYLEADSATESDGQEKIKSEDTASADANEWKKVETDGAIMDILTLCADLVEDGNSQLLSDPSSDSSAVYVAKKAGAFKHFMFMMRLLMHKKEFSESPHIIIVKNVVAFRVKIVIDEGATVNAVKLREEKELAHILDIDGECVSMEGLEFIVRLHPKVIPMYASVVTPDA